MSDTISLTRDEAAILLRAPNFEAYEKVSKRLVAFDRAALSSPMEGEE